MPFRHNVTWLPIVAALLIADAAAQERSAPSRDEAEALQPADEVVVRGRRLEDIEDELRIYIRDFIGEVVAKPPGRGFARWRRNVCVGVHNVESSAAQYIVDRVSSLALEVGLEPGGPGCRPDVTILFASNAKETAALMVESQPRVFRPVAGNAGMNLGLAALDDFVETDKPVRWWHVSLPVGAMSGVPAIEVGKNCGALHCAPVTSVAGPSRIHDGTRDELMYVIIVVDATQLKGTTWQQLGDYVAVLSLAQIDPNTNPAAFDSILNLFSNPAAYPGLTDWDRSYMRALYALDQERVPSQQTNEIVSLIARRKPSAAE